jgi:hypothetical protein
MNTYIPKFFYKKYDGGKESGVTGYFLIEWKKFFSVGILRFNTGSRLSYHSHAFNALTFFLTGRVTEVKLSGEMKQFGPSIWPKFTPRSNVHRVLAHKVTYALTFRGPWEDTWYEVNKDGVTVLTHGRKVVK